MKLHLNDAKVGQILDLYCMYLEQEEEPVSDVVEGIVLYFLTSTRSSAFGLLAGSVLGVR